MKAFIQQKNTQKNLTMNATAVGSLPHDNKDKALELVFDNFSDFPFWPQLSNCNKNDDMILQFVESIKYPFFLFFRKTNARDALYKL